VVFHTLRRLLWIVGLAVTVDTSSKRTCARRMNRKFSAAIQTFSTANRPN